MDKAAAAENTRTFCSSQLTADTFCRRRRSALTCNLCFCERGKINVFSNVLLSWRDHLFTSTEKLKQTLCDLENEEFVLTLTLGLHLRQHWGPVPTGALSNFINLKPIWLFSTYFCLVFLLSLSESSHWTKWFFYVRTSMRKM